MDGDISENGRSRRVKTILEDARHADPGSPIAGNSTPTRLNPSAIAMVTSRYRAVPPRASAISPFVAMSGDCPLAGSPAVAIKTIARARAPVRLTAPA